MREPAQFGELLKRHRLRARLTQEALAEEAGVTDRIIRYLERGVSHRPRADTLARLAEALGLQGEELSHFLAAGRTLPRSDSEIPPLSIAPLWRASVPYTPLIGREAAIEEISALFALPQTRLLTLMGVGGVGKTRLALALAEQARIAPTHFSDGVIFVPLAAINDAALVPSAIATALGLRETKDRSLIEALHATFGERALLLVLDNFEHVVSAATMLVDLLAAAPRVKALVTSRAALSVAIERRIEVPPLPSPADDARLPAAVAISPAVQLFVERSQAVQSDFALTSDNAVTIAAICRQLDGLPLALELAAARMALLSPQALLTRLSQRFISLGGDARDRPARHQTLRAALAWSYDLLTPQAQRIFRALGVFAGGCALDAAVAICLATPPTGAPAAGAALDGEQAQLVEDELIRLREQSLLQRTEVSSDGTPTPEIRLWLLTTVREYALEQLVASGEHDLVAQAHALHYLSLAETAETRLRGPEQFLWSDRLEREKGNIRAALNWFAERAEMTSGLRLAGALWQFWAARGYFSEGRSWLERMLSLADHDAESSVIDSVEEDRRPWLAKALNGAGVLASRQSDYVSAMVSHERALALRRALDDQVGIASSLNNMGGIAMERAEYAHAKALWDESLALRREVGEPRAIALALSNLGSLAHHRAENRRAVIFFEEALPLFQSTGDEAMCIMTLDGYGAALHKIGETERGRRAIEESLTLARRLNLRRDVGLALNDLAHIAYQQGDSAEAKARCDESLALHRETGDRWYQADDLALLGAIAGDQGDFSEAERLHDEAIELRRAIGHKEGIADSLAQFGHLARAQGRWSHALEDYRDALRIYYEVDSVSGIASGLEDVAGALLSVVDAPYLDLAIRICGLAERLRDGEPVMRSPTEQRYYEGTLACGRSLAGDNEFARFWGEGVTQLFGEKNSLLSHLNHVLLSEKVDI